MTLRRDDAPATPPTAMSTLPSDSIVVLPIEIDGLREDAWVRLGAMDLVADRLREAGMTVPPSESVLSMMLAHNGASAQNDAQRVRETTAARLVVRGKATRGASGWKVQLTAMPAQGMELPVEFQGQDAVPAARGATDLLLAALGRALPPESERETAFDETLQRARAAMLANELDTARTILTSSPQLARSPAQLNYRLAQVDFRAGQLDRAERALDAVLEQDDAKDDPRFRAQVLTARGATRVRRGAFADGGQDFEAAIALLTPNGSPLERGLALVGRGNTRVPEHRFDEALADFGAARVALESAGDALGVARVDANLGMLELYRGRPAAALGYLPPAADRFQSFGALHELLLTLTGVIEAQLAMLQHDAALATLERASAVRERITDPDQRVDLLLNRAQVFIGSGRYREAEAALLQAKGYSTSGNRVLLARQRSLDAELAVRARALGGCRSGNTRRARGMAGIRRRRRSRGGRAAAPARAARARSRRRGGKLCSIALARCRKLLRKRRARSPMRSRWPNGRTSGAMRNSPHAGSISRRPARIDAACPRKSSRLPRRVRRRCSRRTPKRKQRRRSDASRRGPSTISTARLLQLRLFHALGPREAWFNALRQTQTLAGEREIPAELLTPVDKVDTLRLGTMPAAGAPRPQTSVTHAGASGS